MTTTNNVDTVAGLEPAAVWSFFARISDVPHPSKHEAQVCKLVRGLAEEHGLTVRQDAAGNLVIVVPASPGCEDVPITVLQGHVDMVGEKNADCSHDFEKDPIRLVLGQAPEGDEQVVRATGTTLGADNGIGVAMGLAVAVSSDVVHGPLEILLTVDEEAGMTGAGALEPGSFEGRCLLNLDSEEDDVLYIGCAGGCDCTLTWDLDLDRSVDGASACKVNVSGLLGGHSGSDINENRANAIKLLVRTLRRGGNGSVRLASLRGGSLRNAIPREAEAVVVGDDEALVSVKAAAQAVAAEAVRESGEQGISIQVEDADLSEIGGAVSGEDTGRLLDALAALPHGVLRMQTEIAGLVETSNNVATVTGTVQDGGSVLRVVVGNLTRSSSATCKEQAADQIAAVGHLAGAAVEIGGAYPGWEPDMDSPILAKCRRVYERLFGEQPNVTAIHAGLECGIIGERVGKIDMVSFGPRIEGAHSPDERVYVASVQKSWKYLLAVLEEQTRG